MRTYSPWNNACQSCDSGDKCNKY